MPRDPLPYDCYQPETPLVGRRLTRPCGPEARVNIDAFGAQPLRCALSHPACHVPPAS